MNTAWFNSQADGVVYLDNWLIGYKGTMPAYTAIDVRAGTKGFVDNAFASNENLYSIVIPDDVTVLGKSTFLGCTNLNFVTIGKGVKAIGDGVFELCTNLISVEIGKNVTRIGNLAFCDCDNLTSLILPSKLTSIGNSAFCNCEKLAYIDIPVGVTSIGSYAFADCPNLRIERIPNGVVAIEDYTFYNCVSLESVTVGNSVKSIGECAFLGCENLTSLSFPIGLTAIGGYAFGECVGLTSIVIPKTVRYIGNNAFGGCHGLTSVTCKAINPPIIGVSEGMDAYLGIDVCIPLFVPASSVSIYGSAEYWCEFIDVRSIIPNHFAIKDPNVGDDFIITEKKDCESITYTRTFNNTNWQALYVPFEIPYENIKDDFDVAYINNVHQFDDDNDGSIDRTQVEAIKIVSGTLDANYPYLIRAKEAGEKTITVEDAVMYVTKENSIDCSSIFDTYTFTGTYSSLSSAELPQGEGYYTLIDGEWQPVTEDVSLGAFRFYLKVDSRSGAQATQARNIRMRIVDKNGGDDVTGLDKSEFNIHNSEIIYDLQGRCVESPTKTGIYIVNGRKVLIE